MQKGKKVTLTKRFSRWLEHSWLLYAAFAATVWTFDHLPLSISRALGRFGGRVAYYMDTRNVLRAMKNLKIAFPDWAEAQLRATLKESYKHLGVALTDVCHFRSATAEDLLQNWIVRDPESDRVMREALAENKGVLGVGAHLGFWEIAGFIFPSLGYPSVCVSNKLTAERIDAMVQRIRGRLGNVIVHQEGAVVRLLRALKEGKTVGIIMDHWGKSSSPVIPFFGQDTRTIDTIARLHIKTGAPIISNMMLRQKDGRYLWRCRRLEVRGKDGLTHDEHIRAILTVCNREIEQAIREYPEQWTWMHKRWR
jgi:KDO2-lipid IV(A) lauroyltransferase